MGKLGKGKRNLTTQTSEEKLAYVQARAARLSRSTSKFGGQVLDIWFGLGCPPVDDLDALLPIMPFGMKTEHSEKEKKRRA